MKAVIYHAFSHKEAEEHDVQELGSQRAEAFVRAFLKQSIPHWSQQDCESHLQRKAVVLEYFTHQKPKQQQKKSKGLTAKQRRDMRLFDINPEQQRYSLFLPLHELWKQYIRDLCSGLKPDTHKIQVPLLCGGHRNPSAGDQACLQDHYQRRPLERVWDHLGDEPAVMNLWEGL
nr:ribonuclease P protein subunit p29 isoform X2 [Peromyscus maniculatus bairdii]